MFAQIVQPKTVLLAMLTQVNVVSVLNHIHLQERLLARVLPVNS